MKVSITARYFGWLVVFILILFFLNFAVDLAHDAMTGELSEEGEVAEEAFELLFMLGANIAVIPLVLLAGWFIAKRMLKPVRSISTTAARITGGEMGARIEVSGDDELAMLARSLNAAFDRYDEAIEQLRRFSSNASHQLRTPLTAIRSKGEIALQKSRTSDEYREVIHGMLEQLERLSHIVEQLLDLSRIEASGQEKESRDVDLSRVVRGVVEEFQPLTQDKRLRVNVSIQEDCVVRGDASLLGQALANLLDNAVRFTPENGEIRVTVETERPGWVTVSVTDTGPGIPEDFRNLAFERFSKGPHPESSGAGLGLAIVAEIVRSHEGHVEALPGPAGGAMIRIRLPSAPSVARAF
ncbi:MAG: HAMP domain-containing protein [Kiritimatiellae bacterium]|nr:HAMP domain-containing protein [Kiritimatiellia bacterium]